MWVPEDQRDTAWYIFNPLFRCRVPNLRSQSLEYLRYYGTPSSGDPVIDRQTANELVDRMLTIEQMATYYKNGVPVLVCQREDTKTIYQHIQNHLLAWAQHKRDSLNPGNTPDDDLRLLDEFADTVYQYARHHFDREFADSFLANHISGRQRLSRSSLLAPRQQEVVEHNTDEEGNKYPSRVSMAEVFASRKAAVGPKWK